MSEVYVRSLVGFLPGLTQADRQPAVGSLSSRLPMYCTGQCCALWLDSPRDANKALTREAHEGLRAANKGHPIEQANRGLRVTNKGHQ
jgi:hypothetical protein